ncbi:unnamed protein product [Pleuronectes platessa]|uniref:Uncharacterized protein n=1 Tax=Pleuronectes platessa TaxID=8262 RepID=A0A9N7Z0P9_PLEPL|nr:unnamed protein product [Pleuronectes platessa]
MNLDPLEPSVEAQTTEADPFSFSRRPTELCGGEGGRLQSCPRTMGTLQVHPSQGQGAWQRKFEHRVKSSSGEIASILLVTDLSHALHVFTSSAISSLGSTAGHLVNITTRILTHLGKASTAQLAVIDSSFIEDARRAASLS